MSTLQGVFLFFSSAIPLLANPLTIHHGPRQAATTTKTLAHWQTVCTQPSCFRTAWKTGPECTKDDLLVYTMSRIMNPPASDALTYTPTKWCTDFLVQVDFSTTTSTTKVVSTSTSIIITRTSVTTTDFSQPTLTKLCPIPSPSMECGLDSDYGLNCTQSWPDSCTIGYDYDSTPEQCHQKCLQDPTCRSYRAEPIYGYPCTWFNVSLGINGTNLHDHKEGIGGKFWDRNCQIHATNICQKVAKRTAPFQITNLPVDTQILQATQTYAPEMFAAAPTPIDYFASLPKYISRLVYPFAPSYLTPACSCLITSARPPISTTTTEIDWVTTRTTTLFSTFTSTHRFYETPHETTITRSIH